MLPYAAYLRVYEPLAAFVEPERSVWAGYAASQERPANALDHEHARALRRLVSVPPVLVPERESRDAYVRRSENETFICPWQTRLRSWEAVQRLRDTAPQGLADSAAADRALADFARWKERRACVRTHILSCTWHIPASWFVPFVPAERGLALRPARALTYVTPMTQARRRIARALTIVSAALGEGSIFGHIDVIGRWLSEFHPGSLVELDYGGLVHLLDDQALRGDESVAELAAALTGLDRGEVELTLAMYSRLAARWRPVQALQSAN